MKVVTSVTVFNDSVGKRMSITYSEVENGKVTVDNKREDRILTDADDIQTVDELFNIASDLIGE